MFTILSAALASLPAAVLRAKAAAGVEVLQATAEAPGVRDSPPACRQLLRHACFSSRGGR